MPKSLLEELPKIAAEGRREAQQLLERINSGTRIGLQTNELVLQRYIRTLAGRIATIISSWGMDEPLDLRGESADHAGFAGGR